MGYLGRAFEVPVRAAPSSVNYAFRNAFVVEMENLFAKNEIF